ncbi:MAG: 30S ribosomal protein S12 methylthiotransferase RimO [Syntrophales bacterium]|nr:30S ribosomal protein S12 methylthiotransferase RimO [Syntrophales bacterium]
MKTFFVNLGCPKNNIDGEVMMGALFRGGFSLVARPEEAEIIIVNTCAFIRPAVEEAIEEILELARYKEKNCRILAVTGCLPKRYGRPLKQALPEVDLFVGPGDIHHLVPYLKKLQRGEKVPFCLSQPRNLMRHEDRVLPPSGPVAYLKIAEGCSNFCSYCLIPRLRGRKRSRPPEDIRQEAEKLAYSGVKEIVLVAQDTTVYGTDLPGHPTLEGLLQDLCTIESVSWIRLLYAHPAHIRESLIEVMADNKKICSYLDLPIQHINDDLLKAMNRGYRRRDVEKIIAAIRDAIPDMALRTTVMVGFPGETEKRFEELLSFLEEIRFDHLGVFPFYAEEGTRAARMTSSRVSRRIKDERIHLITEMQAAISRELNERQIGTRQEILIEGLTESSDFPYRGRTRRQAPDIDGITYVKGEGLEVGGIVEGFIIAADTYDLFAQIE